MAIDSECQKYIDENPVPEEWNWRKHTFSYMNDKGVSPTLPSSVKKLIIDQVVREAARMSLEDFEFRVIEFTIVNDYARQSAFDHVVASSTTKKAEEEKQLGQYSEWTSVLLEKIRQELSNPARLNQYYKSHKKALIEEINTSGKQVTVKKFLKEIVIPIFKEPIDSKIIALSIAETKLENQYRYLQQKLDEDSTCLKALSEKQWEAFKALDENEHSFIIQWRLRRESEGGAELVRMWGDIFQDLEESIDVSSEGNKIQKQLGATGEDAHILEEMFDE